MDGLLRRRGGGIRDGGKSCNLLGWLVKGGCLVVGQFCYVL